jgi:aryl-alcohol dehydrogenase-like predicted oxidoreductase
VKASFDGGINFFDTADTYTEGESEKILGQSLKILKSNPIAAGEYATGCRPNRSRK